MATVICPDCQKEIPSEDINVSTDLAMCRSCNTTYAFSELHTRRNLLRGLEGVAPPAGFRQRATTRGVAYSVTHRSLVLAAGVLAFGLFWNGIVSVFVLLNIANTLSLLDITPPDWFPAAVADDQPAGWGFTLFLWIFLTPFMLVGAGMIGGFFMALGGYTEVRINASEGRIFTGVGPLGRTRKFNPAAVRVVAVRSKHWRDSDGDRRSNEEIVFEMRDGEELKFGGSLKEDRRNYLAAMLQKTLG